VQGVDHPLHGRPVPYNRLHSRLYLAEAAGTALLLFFGLSVVIAFFAAGSALARLLRSAALRRALAGACFGAVLLTGDWSGFWIYLVGPLLGAGLAVALLRLNLFGEHSVQVARLFHFP
jgi:glycerol uptake facilitator-like aquaporin